MLLVGAGSRVTVLVDNALETRRLLLPAGRSTLVFTVCLGAFLGTRCLSAMGISTPLSHHDLASLVVMSEYVVLAEHVGEWDVKASDHTFSVLKVYRGAMLPGETITVKGIGQYDLTGERERMLSGVDSKKDGMKLDPNAVLFLMPAQSQDPAVRRTADGTRRIYKVVASGLRVISQGTVYRFEDTIMLEYSPVRQGRDPDDVRSDSPTNPVTLKTFEKDLFKAIMRVAGYKRALSLRSAHARREALLELMGPPLPLPLMVGAGLPPLLGWYSEVFAWDVIAVLLEGGDPDGALEAVARSWPWLGWPSPLYFKMDDLVDAVRERAAPTHRRVAAVWSYSEHVGGDAVLRLQSILGDEDRDVRLATVELFGRFLQRYRDQLPTDERPDEVQKVLSLMTDRWARETDPQVEEAIERGLTGVPGASDMLRSRATPKSAPIVTLQFLVEEVTPGVLYTMETSAEEMRRAGFQVAEWSLSIRTSLSGGGGGWRRVPLDDITVETASLVAESKVRAAHDDESRKLLDALQRLPAGEGARVLRFKPALRPGRHKITLEARLKGETRRVFKSEPYVTEIPVYHRHEP